MTSSLPVTSAASERAAARRSAALVFSCTLIGALAQLLVKMGTEHLGTHVTLSQVLRDPSLFFTFAFGIFTNFRLLSGYSLLGVMTFLMAMALKGREFSRLYPIIALTYVWVTILSLFVIPGEHLNWFRSAGICSIVGGVSILGLKK